MEFPILIFIGSVLGFIGFVFLVITIVLNKHYRKLYINCTESTIGTFDSLTKGLSKYDDSRSYYPIYKYVINGQQYYFKGHKGTFYKKDVNIENTVIYYNPNNPSQAYTDRKTIDIVMKVFKILGSILFVIGLMLIVLKVII